MRSLLCAFFLFTFCLVNGQDFNARVTVNHAKVQTPNEQIFRNLEMSLLEFLNNRKWASQKINTNERIDLNVLITIETYNNIDRFDATLQLQASRPVYGSGYSTVLLNHEDLDFDFTYVNFQPMDFNDNSFINNLTSVFGYYALVVLGLDGDSFSPNGGSTYFDKAYNVMANAQAAGEPGWNSTDGKNNRNRYWLIENLLNDRFKQFREAYYIYHRKGLDAMSKDVEVARNEITSSLVMLQKVGRAVPNSYLMKVFFNAKANEIVSIYSKALATEKNKVVEILKEIDPANTGKWDQIKR